eukprot:TRINITY_DN224_c0_g1_i2.p1 TRINITY_DN224_c0_g1~~TRINITY_DN224_c0_g1_i2.p1  ORF type:complete len:140 (+),score=46.30 TRINITY_DN224_c0_g1_i2:182-601(+)
MSNWKQYTDYILKGKACEEAFVLELNGNLLHSSSNTTFKVTDIDGYNFDEKVEFLKAFKNNGAPTSEYGLRLFGSKYFNVRFDAERRTWYLKKSGGGACVCFTNKLFLIGTWMESAGQNPGACNQIVEELAQKLFAANF